jgi:CheY-like chemotaxis protein
LLRGAQRSAALEFLPASTEVQVIRGCSGVRDVVTIIVADDDERVRRYFVDVLEFAGYEVLPASTGLEALDLVQRRKDACILLTDVQMPGMDGLCLARQAREVHADIDVVFVTGRDRGDLAALAVPDSCILLKPCRATVLLEAVEMMLANARARSRRSDALVA